MLLFCTENSPPATPLTVRGCGPDGVGSMVMRVCAVPSRGLRQCGMVGALGGGGNWGGDGGGGALSMGYMEYSRRGSELKMGTVCAK